MKNKKRLLTSALGLTLSIAMMGGCTTGPLESGNTTIPKGGEDQTDPSDDGTDSSDIPGVNVPAENPEEVETDPNKLVQWSLFSGGDGDFMEQIIAEYNATSPSKQVQSVMLIWGDYYTKLATAVATDNAPDIGISHASKLPELVDQGIVIPIDDYTTQVNTEWGNYADSVVQSVTFGDQKYAMPLDVHAEILFFNKDIMEEAKVELNADGQLDIGSSDDFKDIMDKVEAVTKDGDAVLSFPQEGDDPYRLWWATYFQMGGSPLINTTDDQITMDKDIAVKAAEYVKSFYDDGYAPAGIKDHQKLFQSGTAGVSFGGTWAIGVYEQTEALNYGAQAMPKLFNDNSGWADAHTLIIPTNKDRSEEDTLSSVEFINYVSGEGAKTWALSGQIPSNVKVQESKDFIDLPQRTNYVDAAETSILPSQSSSFYAMKDVMIQSLNQIWLAQVETAAGIDEMFTQLEISIQ